LIDTRRPGSGTTRQGRTGNRDVGGLGAPFVLAAAFFVAGAADTHGSRQDLEDCKAQAARQACEAAGTETCAAPDPAGASFDLVEHMSACMKAKGYVRVEDLSGVCEISPLPQCFERAGAQ